MKIEGGVEWKRYRNGARKLINNIIKDFIKK